MHICYTLIQLDIDLVHLLSEVSVIWEILVIRVAAETAGASSRVRNTIAHLRLSSFLTLIYFYKLFLFHLSRFKSIYAKIRIRWPTFCYEIRVIHNDFLVTESIRILTEYLNFYFSKFVFTDSSTEKRLAYFFNINNMEALIGK